MRVSGPLWGSMAIQALGAGATLTIGLAIAAWQGPESQGHYGLVRSTADLLVALALFGLPQSLVHAIHQQHANPASLLRWSCRYAVVLLVLALLMGLVAWLSGGTLMPRWLGSPWAWAALLVGSVGWAFQGLQRVLALARGSDVQFAWLSVTPALTLLVTVLSVMAAGQSAFEFALLVSGLTSLLLGAWQLRPLRRRGDWHQGEPMPTRSLMGGGLHAFAQTLVMALQPWVSLQMLRLQGAASPAEVGYFVFAVYVYQLFALPVSFVAPLLFARISRAAGQGRGFETGAWLWPALGLITVAALVAAPVLLVALPTLFGGAYAPAAWACVWMALCGPALLLNRWGVSVLMGRGRFVAATAHAAWRALLLPLAMTLCWAVQLSDRVTAAAFAWLLVEGLCALMLWGLWQRGKVAPPQGVAQS